MTNRVLPLTVVLACMEAVARRHLQVISRIHPDREFLMLGLLGADLPGARSAFGRFGDGLGRSTRAEHATVVRATTAIDVTVSLTRSAWFSPLPALQ